MRSKFDGQCKIYGYLVDIIQIKDSRYFEGVNVMLEASRDIIIIENNKFTQNIQN